jgi:hypothetical protein
VGRLELGLHDAEHVAEPVVAGLELTEVEFTRWATAMGYRRPNFWASGEEKDLAPGPVQRVSEETVKSLAKEYIASKKQEGRQPTQAEFEDFCEERLIRGRGMIRRAYKEIAKQAQINVRPGRYSKYNRNSPGN